MANSISRWGDGLSCANGAGDEPPPPSTAITTEQANTPPIAEIETEAGTPLFTDP